MLSSCDSSIKQATQSLIKFDTENGIVDAILTEKQEKATTVNTVITFEGTVASSAIVATDLCVIFGNTLDNAIGLAKNYTLTKKNKYQLYVRVAMDLLFYITNLVAKNIVITNNNIKTSKQDKSNHGFGLYSLKKAIDKYDGSLNLSCDNNLFMCNVVLNA